MKILIILIAALYSLTIFGQELAQMDECIEIQFINHHYYNEDDISQTIQISNRGNEPHRILFLDTMANIVEVIGYGKHHYASLTFIDYITRNKYHNNKIIETIEYKTDYDKNINATYKTKYIYNNINKLIYKIMLDCKNEELIYNHKYEYDTIRNEEIVIFDSSLYYKYIYNNNHKLISYQQISENKLRWSWNYIYTDSARIGDFETFYKDGNNHAKQETIKYENNKIIEVIEKATNRDAGFNKTIYRYNELGLIVRIENYITYSQNIPLELEIYQDILVKYCRNLSPSLIDKINYEIRNN